MHPIFIARGPAFRTGYVAEPFEVVDIYPLMCRILDLTPAVNDGSLNRIKHILTDEHVAMFDFEMETSFVTCEYD